MPEAVSSGLVVPAKLRAHLAKDELFLDHFIVQNRVLVWLGASPFSGASETVRIASAPPESLLTESNVTTRGSPNIQKPDQRRRSSIPKKMKTGERRQEAGKLLHRQVIFFLNINGFLGKFLESFNLQSQRFCYANCQNIVAI